MGRILAAKIDKIRIALFKAVLKGVNLVEMLKLFVM